MLYRVFAILIVGLTLYGAAEAFTHGKAVQPSGSNLISGASEFLKSGGGDQLVSQ